MYGNVPDLDDPVDGLLYGGKLALDGLGAIAAGWKYSFSKASGRIVTKAGPSMVDDGLNIATFEFRASSTSEQKKREMKVDVGEKRGGL